MAQEIYNMQTHINNPEGLEYIDPDIAPYRFDEWATASDNYLKEEGFVVIKSILNPDEIIHAKSLLWKFLANQGWKRNDPRTWDAESKFVGGNGVVWGRGAGHCDYTWFIRTRPRVVQTFADLWSDQDIYRNRGIRFGKNNMITSFDGLNVFRPWYLSDEAETKWKSPGAWYHVDQNVKSKPFIDTVQGIVTLYDQDMSTGSTVVVPGSHHWIQSVLSTKSNSNGIVDCKLEQRNARKLLICCKAGDLVLWDSRTIHCSSPALLSAEAMQIKWNRQNGKNKKQTMTKQLNDDDTNEQAITNNDIPCTQLNNVDVDDVNAPRLLRAVSYVCMTPKIKITDLGVMRQRLEAFASQSTWSHSPHDGKVLYTPQNFKRQRFCDIENRLKRTLIVQQNILEQETVE